MSITMWTVYDRPRDYPDHVVVRRWKIRDGVPSPTDEHFTFDSLEEARASIPPGLAVIPRFADDDPKIVEVWM